MGNFLFGKDVVRRSRRLRLALAGHSKAGKTWTALTIATGIIKYLREHEQMVGNGRIAHICTEKGAVLDYQNDFDFDPGILSHYAPTDYISAIKEIAQLDYTVLIIDQISHAWSGNGGLLEMHANATKEDKKRNGFMAWQKVNPVLNSLLETILDYPNHTICTMRSKVKYRQDKDGQVHKIGTRPIMRNEIEFEFTAMGSMDTNHCLKFDGSRCQAISHRTFDQPTVELGERFGEWIVAGRVDQEMPLSSLDAKLVEEVQQLSRRLGMTQADLIDVLARRGVSSIESLPLAKAQDLIRTMKSKIREDQRQAVVSHVQEVPETPPVIEEETKVPQEEEVAGPPVPEVVADLGGALAEMLVSSAPPASEAAPTVPDTREERIYLAKCLAQDLGYDRERWTQHVAAVADPNGDGDAGDINALDGTGVELLISELQEITRIKAEDPAEFARLTSVAGSAQETEATQEETAPASDPEPTSNLASLTRPAQAPPWDAPANGNGEHGVESDDAPLPTGTAAPPSEATAKKRTRRAAKAAQ